MCFTYPKGLLSKDPTITRLTLEYNDSKTRKNRSNCLRFNMLVDKTRTVIPITTGEETFKPNQILPITNNKFTETTTVEDSDGTSKHRLMPTLPTFYGITLIINDYWILAPTELKNVS